MQLVLHEHEIPELEVAFRVVAWPVAVRPEVGAPVEIELRAWSARARGSRLPEVVLAAQPNDALIRDANRSPALDGLLVGPEAQLLIAAENGDPDPLRVESKAIGVRGQLPGELGGALLEVVAHREVAEHLEEREVTGGGAHYLDVDGAKALLAAGEPGRGGLLLTTEVGLELLHARRGEQHRRVVAGRHQRRGRHPRVTPRLEKGEKALANLWSGHPNQSRCTSVMQKVKRSPLGILLHRNAI